ncbi:hypothetical protein HG530_000643 [Fusarium avenaceum]|nr:hypothetical protein HG530_000643 [Fusarium avenaceum]
MYRQQPGNLGILNTVSDNIFEAPARGLEGNSVLPSPLFFVLACDTFGEVVQSACNTSGELDLQHITNFVTGSQQAVQILLVVGGRNAETGTRADEWSRGITNNNYRNVSSQHLMTEGRELGGVVEHDRNDRGIIVTVNDKTKALKSETEVSRVKCNTLKTFLALTRAQLASDELQRSQDLHENTRSRSLAILSSSVGALELVDDVLVGCEISTIGTKRLGQSSHENIDF